MREIASCGRPDIPLEWGSPLDDVEYLARSANRVRVLEALAERPRDRTDLQ